MSKSLFATIVATSAVLTSSTPAKAVTAEETFAFIAFNLEHGSIRTFGGSRVKILKKSDNPLTYEVSQPPGSPPIEWTIHPNKGCVFDTEIVLESDRYYAKFHMEKSWDIDWYASTDGQNTPKIRFLEECGMENVDSKGQRLGCESRVSVGSIFKRDVILERAKKAVAYFQENFCAGAPF